MKTVYQIVLGGDVSDEIQECLNTVKDWAHRLGYAYVCDTCPSKKYEGRDYRVTSDWMRLEKLASQPYVCYVDWDIKILKDIILGENVLTSSGIDSFLYFGKDIEPAKTLLHKAKELYTGKEIDGFVYDTFNIIFGNTYTYNILQDIYYVHLGWHNEKHRRR